ncbi:MAG: class I SAM-dependent methyltransferase [Planctomycetes bacterium]|nr:class I SAM-dependent methyltransferase [Planctomycetota bacterium]
MDGIRANLKLFAGDNLFSTDSDAPEPITATRSSVSVRLPADPVVLANRELIRPLGHSRAACGLVPFSAAWYDELEQKRYQRHGSWLSAALEFGRHPGESLLLLGPGLGSDAVHYARTGTPVTVGLVAADYPELVRENLSRHLLPIRTVNVGNTTLPFPDGAFDVVTWNALHDFSAPAPSRVSELFRVLKAGGKVIGLFPARYDAGYWQDLILPLQWLYWQRPADPTTGPKLTSRQLRQTFGIFHEFKVSKRHLRRSELPHPWRVLPLVFLERMIGRVLVFKAMKPLSARSGLSIPLAA